MSTKSITPSTGNVFPSIDILRGFAAVSVVVYHVIEHFGWKTFPVLGPLLWFRIGWMGVDIFFVISGFVIGLSAFRGYHSNGIAFRRSFAVNRLARIVPLYILTSIVYICFISPQLFYSDFLWNGLTHVLFIHNLFPAYHGAVNGVNWSLGVEMQFYVFVMLATPFLVRIKWQVWFPGLVLVSWAWRLGVTLAVPEGEEHTFMRFFGTTQLPGALDHFAMGLLLARLATNESGGKVYAFARKYPALPLALASLTGYAALNVFWTNANYWDNFYMVVGFRTLLAIPISFCILSACSLNGRTWLNVTRPLQYIGTISYGIYLWHLPLIESFKRLTWLEPQRAIVAVTLTTLGLAICSWHFFEKPMMTRWRAIRA